MKKEIIMWQILVLVLCMALIFTINKYLNNKNNITAKTNRAECLIKTYQNENTSPINDLKIICDKIIDIDRI